jgi:acyl carrier protein
MNEQNREQELRKLLSELCEADVAEFELDADLVHELGLDSLAGLRMLAAVEKRFDVRFPDERLKEFRTLRLILEIINVN